MNWLSPLPSEYKYSNMELIIKSILLSRVMKTFHNFLNYKKYINVTWPPYRIMHNQFLHISLKNQNILIHVFFFLCWKADRTYTIHHETENNKKKSTINSFCYLRLAPTRLINHHWYSDSFAEEIFLNKHLR